MRGDYRRPLFDSIGVGVWVPDPQDRTPVAGHNDAIFDNRSDNPNSNAKFLA
jgi:hypothetical protein